MPRKRYEEVNSNLGTLYRTRKDFDLGHLGIYIVHVISQMSNQTFPQTGTSFGKIAGKKKIGNFPFHDSEAEKCSLITLRATFFSSFPKSLPQLPGKRRGWGKKVCEGFLKWARVDGMGGKVCACVLSSRSKVGVRGGVG